MTTGISGQTNQSTQLGQLLMLASSNLPIGSYTYSQGVESAIESGIISDEASTLTFMQDYLALAVIGYELPVLGLIIGTSTLRSYSLDNSTSAVVLRHVASRTHASSDWA